MQKLSNEMDEYWAKKDQPPKEEPEQGEANKE